MEKTLLCLSSLEVVILLRTARVITGVRYLLLLIIRFHLIVREHGGFFHNALNPACHLPAGGHGYGSTGGSETIVCFHSKKKRNKVN
jgi:hypothetical protein